MCLLYEMSLGADSFWAPYLRTLPYPATLADWAEADLAELQHGYASGDRGHAGVRVMTQRHAAQCTAACRGGCTASLNVASCHCTVCIARRAVRPPLGRVRPWPGWQPEWAPRVAAWHACV